MGLRRGCHSGGLHIHDARTVSFCQACFLICVRHCHEGDEYAVTACYGRAAAVSAVDDDGRTKNIADVQIRVQRSSKAHRVH